VPNGTLGGVRGSDDTYSIFCKMASAASCLIRLTHCLRTMDKSEGTEAAPVRTPEGMQTRIPGIVPLQLKYRHAIVKGRKIS
ncbi:hypothetical protein, partial [Faecalibaculum rodentium]|uniref:hypothetical protein n=1 Tax=Faecalibaculum rodentium TaxID=1702221 RepID=UPI0026F2F37D